MIENRHGHGSMSLSADRGDLGRTLYFRSRILSKNMISGLRERGQLEQCHHQRYSNLDGSRGWMAADDGLQPKTDCVQGWIAAEGGLRPRMDRGRGWIAAEDGWQLRMDRGRGWIAGEDGLPMEPWVKPWRSLQPWQWMEPWLSMRPWQLTEAWHSMEPWQW